MTILLISFIRVLDGIPVYRCVNISLYKDTVIKCNMVHDLGIRIALDSIEILILCRNYFFISDDDNFYIPTKLRLRNTGLPTILPQ